MFPLVGAVNSVDVACGEMYRILKNRSIPSDFLSSTGIRLPQHLIAPQVTPIREPAMTGPDRHFLQLFLGFFPEKDSKSGKFCQQAAYRSLPTHPTYASG